MSPAMDDGSADSVVGLGKRVCEALTKAGRPCRNDAVHGRPFCVQHLPPEQQPETVTVTRQRGDWRKIDVPFASLDGWHLGTLSGGVRTPSPTPILMAYMWCDLIPEGVEFGHSCEHGPGPHRIKVIVQKTDNRASFRDLRRLAEARASR